MVSIYSKSGQTQRKARMSCAIKSPYKTGNYTTMGYEQDRDIPQDMPMMSESAAALHKSDGRTSAILRNAKEQKDVLDQMVTRKRFQFRKWSKMPFKLRLGTFAAIFAAILLVYLLDFFAGGNLGIALNAWTDSLVENGIHAFCAAMADITGSDWSGRELALFRLMTLGCASFVFFAFITSLAAAGIIAIIWSYNATRRSEDDGTSNFMPENKTNRKGVKTA